ncbi:hypothetical protein FG91_01563 [Sphingopyxis sp. LC81]|nr:hypothetical protein FG91_01563 [Sphingopyxis sp. LC81]
MAELPLDCWEGGAVEGPQDLRKPPAPFDELLKAREQLADGGFEAWLYAPIDGEVETPETEEQALEAQWAEEDLKLRLKVAGGVAIAAVFLGMPIVTLFSTSWGVQIPFIWAFMNIPLLTLAVITWRRRELRFGVKRPVKGHKARIMAVLLVLFSFFSFVLAAASTMLS